MQGHNSQILCGGYSFHPINKETRLGLLPLSVVTAWPLMAPRHLQKPHFGWSAPGELPLCNLCSGSPHMLGEAHQRKPSTLARQHSNYLHEVF